jgi:hypothetical protein
MSWGGLTSERVGRLSLGIMKLWTRTCLVLAEISEDQARYHQYSDLFPCQPGRRFDHVI